MSLVSECWSSSRRVSLSSFAKSERETVELYFDWNRPSQSSFSSYFFFLLCCAFIFFFLWPDVQREASRAQWKKKKKTRHGTNSCNDPVSATFCLFFFSSSSSSREKPFVPHFVIGFKGMQLLKLTLIGLFLSHTVITHVTLSRDKMCFSIFVCLYVSVQPLFSMSHFLSLVR